MYMSKVSSSSYLLQLISFGLFKDIIPAFAHFFLFSFLFPIKCMSISLQTYVVCPKLKQTSLDSILPPTVSQFLFSPFTAKLGKSTYALSLYFFTSLFSWTYSSQVLASVTSLKWLLSSYFLCGWFFFCVCVWLVLGQCLFHCISRHSC